MFKLFYEKKNVSSKCFTIYFSQKNQKYSFNSALIEELGVRATDSNPTD